MVAGLTEESRHEIQLKDEEYEALPETFVPPPSGWRSEFTDKIEIPPHLNALHPLVGRRVLELGCGDGRFTTLMAQSGAEVLAIDFSFEGLRKASWHLAKGSPPTSYQLRRKHFAGDLRTRVGLVQADASRFHVAPRGFSRALSATPLDSRDERMEMYRSVAEALTEDGRFVAGVEYDDLYRRVLGLPKVRRYSRGGILIEHLNIATMRREMSPYFGRLRMQPIRVHLPFVRLLPIGTRVVVSRCAASTPILKHLGDILLVSAERPWRLPQEGVRRPGYFGASAIYRRYKCWRGEEPIWSMDEYV